MSSTPQFDPAPSATPETGRAAMAGSVSEQPCFPAWLVAALLGVLTLALYWPTIGHEFINFDDNVYVTENVHVRTGLTFSNITWAFLNTVTGNWHPLTMISHMLDCQLFDLKPWGHHLTSVLLHALNTMLVFLWLRRLTGAVWRSALVAALFGWHPINVESVAWVAERKSVLSLCFGLLTLLFYTCYAQNLEIADRQGAARRAYWWALSFFALGLMCKAILVTWPGIFFLLDYWPLGRFEPGRRWPIIREKIPFIALVVAVSAITILCHREVGDMAAIGSLHLDARVENSFISYCRYLGKLFWPVNLAAFYPHPGYWPMAKVQLAVIFLALITLVMFVARRRHRFLLVGWLWFLGTLVPVIGLMQVGGQSMADRHAYIPALGIFIIVIWGAYELVRRRPIALAALSSVGFAALILCAAVTRHQLRYWQDSEILFRHALAVTESNFLAHFNLGCALDTKGRTDEAIKEYEKTLDLQPNIPAVHNNLGAALIKQGRLDEGIRQLRECIRLMPEYGLAHENLGNCLLTQGHTDAAIKEFEEGVRLQPEVDIAAAHYNLGVALNQAGQTNAAIREFQKTLALLPDYGAARINLVSLFSKTAQTNAAISLLQEAVRLAPGDIDAHYNLANIFISQGRIAEAINQFQADLHLNPDDADAHYNLGKALLDQGRADAAIAELQAAFRLKKYDAGVHYNLGNLLAKKGQTDAAIAQFQETIRLKPDNADAHNNLGNLLAKTGQTEAAIRELQAALRLKPEDGDTHYNLGYAYLKTGRIDDAIRQFQEAIRLKPDYAPAHYNLAVMLDKKGQTDLAIVQFKEAIRLQPNYAIAHNGLGVALTTQGRIDEAITQFQAALQISPNYASAQNNLARALASKGPPAGMAPAAVKP